MRLPIPCGDISDVIANIDWKIDESLPGHLAKAHQGYSRRTHRQGGYLSTKCKAYCTECALINGAPHEHGNQENPLGCFVLKHPQMPMTRRAAVRAKVPGSNSFLRLTVSINGKAATAEANMMIDRASVTVKKSLIPSSDRK
jgi:hypothetical protein